MPLFYCSWCFFMFRYTHVEHHQPSAETLVMCVTGADHHHHCRCCLCSTWRSFPSETPFESDFFPWQCRCLYSAHVVLCSCGSQRQPGKKCLASIIQVRVVYTQVPQREVSVSIYKLYLWQLCLLTGGTAWQNSKEIGIHLAPPGALLDAVHIAGCFKFLTLEELSCVIFLQSSFCLLTGILSECWHLGYVFK